MSVTSYINTFLKTEITVIPSLLDKYVGKYYNNTICNGATWMFALWYLFHSSFDHLLNALLKKMRYKEHTRVRLIRSLWYLGFYCAALMYSCATLIQYSIPVLNIRFATENSATLSLQLVLGFVVLTTFFLHSSLWELLKYEHKLVGCSYFVLFLMVLCSYYVRFVEGALKLTILISMTRILLELARCVVVLVTPDTILGEYFVKIIFAMSLMTYTVNFIIVIPYLLGHSFLPSANASGYLLMGLTFTWLMIEIYNSVLFKAAYHLIHHRTSEKTCICAAGSAFECCLFPPRSDAAYNLNVFYQEIKERQEHFMALRKPRKKNMIVQTMKCMIALKRKLAERRNQKSSSSSSDSDDVSSQSSEEAEDSENSELLAKSDEIPHPPLEPSLEPPSSSSSLSAAVNKSSEPKKENIELMKDNDDRIEKDFSPAAMVVIRNKTAPDDEIIGDLGNVETFDNRDHANDEKEAAKIDSLCHCKDELGAED